MIRLSCDTIKRLCEIAPPNTQQASDIRSLLKDFDDIHPLIHSIDAERLLIGEWMFNLTKDELYKTGLENITSFTITEGLQEGDSVIYKGNLNLAHDAKVTIN